MSKEDLYHLFFNCSYAPEFWKIFIAWWYGLSGESLNLGLKSIIVGIVDRVDAFGNVEEIKGYLILGCFRKREELKGKLKNKRLPEFHKMPPSWELFL